MLAVRSLIFPLCFLGYVGIMFYISSLYNSVIMEPIQLIWAFFFLFVGPLLLIISAVKIFSWRKISLSRKVLYSASIIMVLLWSFFGGYIGQCLRPIAFSYVVNSNSELAEQFMMKIPENESKRLVGFRYPYFKMFAPASHSNGVLKIVVPSAPGPKDTIIYDPNSNVNHRNLINLHGQWWLSKAR